MQLLITDGALGLVKYREQRDSRSAAPLKTDAQFNLDPTLEFLDSPESLD